MLKIDKMPAEKVFFLGAGMVMISKTEIEGCPALVLTQAKEPSDDKIGTSIQPEDLDEDWFRENSAIIAFATAAGACNFLERLHEVVVQHGQKIGFVDENGEIKEEFK